MFTRPMNLREPLWFALLTLLFSGCGKTLKVDMNATSPGGGGREFADNCNSAPELIMEVLGASEILPGGEVEFRVSLQGACPGESFLLDNISSEPLVNGGEIIFSKTYGALGQFSESVVGRSLQGLEAITSEEVAVDVVSVLSGGRVSVSQSQKYTYNYLEPGLNLLDRDGQTAVATGYGSGAGFGIWGIVGGNTQLQVTSGDGDYENLRSCGENQVAVGVTAFGVLRCKDLLPDFELLNRSEHSGGWGYSVDVRCPAGKVLVEWNSPSANYVVSFSCAEIHRK